MSRHAKQTAGGIRREQDVVVAAPRSSTRCRGGVGERQWQTAEDTGLFQLPVRKEADEAAIWRPERVRGILGAGKFSSLSSIE